MPTAAAAGIIYLLDGCERHGVSYTTGLTKNACLNDLAERWTEDAGAGFAETGIKQRRFGEFRYAAQIWSRARRVIACIEHDHHSSNPRYIVTNLPGDLQALYGSVDCARGDMENRIKEQQLDLFADRTSCHDWWPNQFRLLLASFAYTFVAAIRR